MTIHMSTIEYNEDSHLAYPFMHGVPLLSMPNTLLQRHAERILLGMRALEKTCMHGSKTQPP
jgi:hypothetical protein